MDNKEELISNFNQSTMDMVWSLLTPEDWDKLMPKNPNLTKLVSHPAILNRHESTVKTMEEWEEIKKEKAVQVYMKNIGGFGEARLVPCGVHTVLNNWQITNSFVRDDTTKYRMCSGWLVFVGQPTGIKACPHFWVEEIVTGRWISLCGEPDETHFLLVKSGEGSLVKSALTFTEANGTTWQPVSLTVPCRMAKYMTSSVQFKKNIWGTTNEMTYWIWKDGAVGSTYEPKKI